MEQLNIMPMELCYLQSYWVAVGAVMAEGKYLSRLEGFPFEGTELFVKGMLRSGTPFLVAVEPKLSRVVGWADANRMENRPHTGYLGMGLLKEYRGLGLGRRLLLALMDRCRAFGDTDMVLDVRASNERAIRLYQSLGFVLEEIQNDAIPLFEQTADGFADTGKKEGLLRMSCSLLPDQPRPNGPQL